MTGWKERLQRANRDTVLRVLVVLVSVSMLINTANVTALIMERRARLFADATSLEDRNVLRQRARIVECFIVGVLDPAVERQRKLGFSYLRH